MDGGAMEVEINAFYKFVALPHFAQLRTPLCVLCVNHGIRGTILLAPEGINGTIAGEPEDLAKAMAAIRDFPEFAKLEHKTSFAPDMPFRRLKVRLKKEIVTIGAPGVDSAARVGRYVAPQDWNALISDRQVLVIDARNTFEVAAGTFKGAIDPGTERFSGFPAYARAQLGGAKHKKIAIFCTGGIRCEKASSFLLQEGFTEVYHLKGGILNYLERIPPNDSLWEGECFVFDQREAVDHRLRPVKLTEC